MIGVVKALRSLGEVARRSADAHLQVYFEEHLQVSSWYSEKDNRDLTLLLGELLRSSVRGDVWHALGATGAERDFTGAYAAAVRVGDPEWTIRRMPEGWRQFHDSGDLSVVDSARGTARMRLTAFPVMCPQIAQVNAGYFEGVLRVVGVSQPRVEVLSSDARSAAWKLTWK